jgi:ligand-binding sensor domain-containing protein
VYQILQDKEGYIWFATDNGVSQFNGYSFRNFSVTDGLHSQVVFKMFEDSKGRIWFNNFDNHLSFYHNDSICHYKFNHKIPGHPTRPDGKGNVKTVTVDSLDNVYIEWYYLGYSTIDSAGNYSYDNYTKTDSIVLMEMGKSKHYCGYFPPSNKIFLKNKMLPITTPWKATTTYLKSNFYSNINNLYYITRLDSNSFAFAIGKSFYLYMGDKTYTIPVPANLISFNIDSNKDIWIGTLWRKGVYCYSFADGYQKPSKHYLPELSVTFTLRDKEGGLWFSTIEDGVYYYPNDNILNYNKPLKSKDILKIATAEKAIYFVAYDKLYMLDEFDKLHNVINEDVGYFRMVEYKNDILWLSAAKGLYQFKGLKQLSLNAKAFNSNLTISSLIVPRSIHPISSNKFYAAPDRGLKYYSLNTNAQNTLHRFIYENGNFEEVVRDFANFDEKSFLAASDKGLYLVTPNPLVPYMVQVEDLGSRHPVLKTRIDVLQQSKFDGRYYIGTKERGLLVWDTALDTVIAIDKLNGLTDYLVSSIFITDSTIWVGTKQGLNRLTPVARNSFKYNIFSITSLNGLPTNEVNGIAQLNGKIYVATSEGLCYFDPNKVTPNTYAPPIYISRVFVNGKNVSPNQPISLRYNQNEVAIEFIGLAFRTTGNVQYRYKILGIDTNWHYTKNRDVRFPKLQSGKYLFSVSARNEDGKWSSSEASFSFVVRKPYWETTIFKVFTTLLVIIIVLILYRLRIREIHFRNNLLRSEEHKRHKLQEELTNERQRALIQQMNPHFLFNALNSIQSLIYSNSTNEARHYLNSFAKLMRITLENIQEQHITIDKEISSLTLYLELEKLRLNNFLYYTISVDPKIDPYNVKVPAMLIQPYVENSIIHGIKHKPDEMGVISIDLILCDSNTILCRIEDNGIGRKKSAEMYKQQNERYKSYGSLITEKRLELINELYGRSLDVKYIDLEDHKGIPQGTIVEIKMPLEKR